MRKLNNFILLQRTGFSFFLIVIFIGIFFLSYYFYHTLSITYLNQEYQNIFLKQKYEISLKINQTLNQDEVVNINRIIEPYLSDKIDLLVVYHNDEIIQIFTKKGVPKKYLRELDKIYTSHKDEMMNIYFGKNPNVKSNHTIQNQNNQNFHDYSLLALTAIVPEFSEMHYHYLLVFSLDKYRQEKASLINTINRNSFYAGATLLGLVGLILLLHGIKLRSQKQWKGETYFKEPANELISHNLESLKEKTSEEKAMKNEDGSSEKIEGKSNNKISMYDTIEHNQDDDFFSKDDLVQKNWINSNDPSVSVTENFSGSNESLESNQEVELLDPKKKLIRSLYSQAISTLDKANYEEIIDSFLGSQSLQGQELRPFSKIIDQKETLEQKKTRSSRLKELLGIWLFAQPIPEKEEKLIGHLIQKSLKVIGYPEFTETERKVFEYFPPSVLLHFFQGGTAQMNSRGPVLTTIFPKFLNQQGLASITVPWLGKEKKFFKKGLPYIEKKSQVISMIVSQVIGNDIHVVKALYVPKDYEALFYEQKLELLYLIEVIFHCLTKFSELHQQLFQIIPLKKKVEQLFKFIFGMDIPIIEMLVGTHQIPTLHFSLWTFESKTYPQEANINYRKMMAQLPNQLHNVFQEQSLLFLSDGKNYDQLLSVGYNHTFSGELSLSEKIKSAIEKILIEGGGMSTIQFNWKETPLPIPKPDQEDLDFEKFL